MNVYWVHYIFELESRLPHYDVLIYHSLKFDLINKNMNNLNASERSVTLYSVNNTRGQCKCENQIVIINTWIRLKFLDIIVDY